MLTFSRLIPQLDRQVERILTTQVVDPSRPDHGAFINAAEGMAGSACISTTASMGYAYLLPESKFYTDRNILDRIRMAAAYTRRARHPSGRLDLIITNFESAPDTAFAVQALAPVVKAARTAADDGVAGAGTLADELGEIIRTATPGMVRGGFHTPNHRWVLTAALALAQELFPELNVRDTIDAYLRETIDINADGEYTERSSGVYNAICNRALRLAAEALDRPELLAPVRRNLDLSYHLLHADGTVVTSLSTRQDLGTEVVPVGLADSYYTLGRLDGNPFYLAVADWLCACGGGGTPWTLQPFLQHPEWREDAIERPPLPDRFSKTYPTAGIWRVRRGRLSATAAAGITAPFSVRYGQAKLQAVRISSTYFATGRFIGEDFREEDGRVLLHHYGKNRIYTEKDYPGPVYWLPIDETVDASNWREVRGRRATYALPPLQVDLAIVEVDRGFDVRITSSGGMDGVPFQIECVFAPGGELEFDGGLIETAAGQTAFLKRGYATYRVGNDAVAIGPGAMAHRMRHMRNSEDAPASFRVLITLVTPVDHVLEIRCGAWSPATGFEGRDAT